MPNLNLTDLEKAAFYQEITRDRALDYFFVFDNVPLHFIYRDKVISGVLSDLEKRNKGITETLWLEAYHQYLVANVGYVFLYRGSVLQMAFQVHQFGAGAFTPPAEETRPFRATREAVQANFEAWMAEEGWKLADNLRQQPPRGSWKSFLGAPDRTVRIASIIPAGNQVVMELITTWTEAGILKETAWAVVLIYDADGTVLQDRSYIDLANWPSARRYAKARSTHPQDPPQDMGAGVMEQFYKYHRSRQISAPLSDSEKRYLSIIEGAWLHYQNTGLDAKVIHPDRFRMQWPLQKFSCNLRVANEIEAIIRESVPDRKMRLGLTYAKGNQVAAEGVVSWTEEGLARETPFISFLLLDKDGRVIRERRYFAGDQWPDADRLKARLDL